MNDQKRMPKYTSLLLNILLNANRTKAIFEIARQRTLYVTVCMLYITM